jgi:cytochrome c oxidase cbb3-type subunit 4
MDINTLRSLITLFCFIAFIVIVWWAYSGRQRARFDEAANLPFADDNMQNNTVRQQQIPPSSTSNREQ